MPIAGTRRMMSRSPGWTAGVTWDESDPSPLGVRTGKLIGETTGSSPGDAKLPIHRNMRRCILTDAGVVQYYLDPTDSTKKIDGTASNLDGTDGQVMVEIPKFYHKYGYSGTEHSYSISDKLWAGYEVHPAFIKNGMEVPYRYFSAYEGSMYDDSAGAMVGSGDIATNMYASGDKLCSYSGEYPKTNETRAEFRAMAAQRGTGWRQQDYDLISAIQLLYLVEYASFYSQDVIGEGRTQLSGGTWAAGSYIGQCGLSNGDGNGTNCVEYSGDADDPGADAAYMTWRGIENFFGNVWKWVDGFNINGNIPYVSNTDTDFDDDTTTNYTRLTDTGGSGITLHNAEGYQVTLEQIKRGFLPASVGGSSATYITDYYWQAANWRVAALGGVADCGGQAGFFCWALNNASGYDDFHVGGRLCF